MSDDRDKSCGEMSIEAVIKAVANALALLIMIGIMAFWEFVINPNNNYSIYATGDNVYSVAGVMCNEERVRWHFQMQDMWYSNDKSHVRLLIWVQNTPDDTPSRIQTIEVEERTSIKLEGCEGDREAVAYLWSINRTDQKAHLRVRKYEIGEARYYTIPTLEGEGR